MENTRFARRQFLKQGAAMATVGAVSSQLSGQPAGRSIAVSTPVAHPPAQAIRNRAPLQQNHFIPLPLTSVRPAGWLQEQLRVQANGLGGHLDEVWADVGPNSGWLGGTGESWERGPYFLDGLVPLAYLLDDNGLKAKAQKYIEWTLTHQRPNGEIGPASNNDWWPRMVMLKVLTQYQEATGDARVLPLMERYFAGQLSTMPTRPLRDWGKYRWQDESLSVLWLYNRTGNPRLLDLARLLRQQGHDWRGEFEHFRYTYKTTLGNLHMHPGTMDPAIAMDTHGVNNAMGLKASPVGWLVSGDSGDRAAINHQLQMLDRYHGEPNGMFSADEHFAGLDPSQGTELCAVVEAMFSLEQAVAVLGDARLADRLERLAFNALPGTFTDDMWAHQYDQQSNQIRCNVAPRQWSTNNPDSNLYGLAPNFGCCTANLHQGWPKLAASLWMATPDHGLAAIVYAPCSVHTLVAGKVPVRLTESTEYPFRETVSIQIDPEQPARFPLLLRVPEWARGAVIRVNGQPAPAPAPGSFARLDRIWQPGDRVEIRFPMPPRISRWYHNSIAVERGPVVYSLALGTRWEKVVDRGPDSDWAVYPTTPWNYALAINEQHPEASIAAVERPAAGPRFTASGAPIELHVKARRLETWTEQENSAGPLPPVRSRAAHPKKIWCCCPMAPPNSASPHSPNWPAPEGGPGLLARGPRATPLALHSRLIRRRPIQCRHRNVIQPHVHGELGAVVNEVIHHEVAQQRRARHRENHGAVVQQRPGTGKMRVAGASDGRARLGRGGIEASQQFGVGRWRLGALPGRNIQTVVAHNGGAKARQRRHVRRQPSHRSRLLMRPPAELLLRNPLQTLPRIRHFVIELW